MKNSGFSIGNRYIDSEHETFLIAEIGQAHDGSLGTAHAYIDAVSEAGADAIKFQTHIADEESTLDEPFRVQFSKQDATRYEYWKRMEFTKGQWKDLSLHAKKNGLIFLSSTFSVAGARMLRDIGMPAWKIGSGEINSKDLLNEMAKNGSPLLISTGMSNFNEILLCIERIREYGLQFALFQCTTRYPSSLYEIGLNVIDELRYRFHCPVGLSDHSGSVFPSLAAIAMRSELIEVHVTFDRRLFGPDVQASITIDELGFLVKAKKSFFIMHKNPVDKDEIAKMLLETKTVFTKSIAPSENLKAGTLLKPEMLKLKKPGSGIPETELEKIIGRTLRRDVNVNELLKWKDLK